MGLHVTETQKTNTRPRICPSAWLISTFSLLIFTLNRTQDDGTVIIRISVKSDNILTEYHSASFHICVDFSIHHKEWLIHSNTTDEEPFLMQQDIRTLLASFLHRVLKNSALQNIYLSVLNFMPNQSHPLIWRSI